MKQKTIASKGKKLLAAFVAGATFLSGFSTAVHAESAAASMPSVKNYEKTAGSFAVSDQSRLYFVSDTMPTGDIADTLKLVAGESAAKEIGSGEVMDIVYGSDIFRCGGYKFSVIDADKIVPVIQHELNHLNKRRETYMHTVEYKEQYKKLMELIQEKNPAVVAIANIIYRYCIKTEAEAYTEQFYKEWIRIFKDNNPLLLYKLDRERGHNLPTEKYTEYAKQTSTYKTFAMIHNWLTENKDTLISSYADILYDKFCNIAEYFLKIRPGKYGADNVTWCKEFIYRIE